MDLVYQRWVIWVRQMDLIFNGAWKFSHLIKCVIKSQNNSEGICVSNQYIDESLKCVKMRQKNSMHRW